MTIASSVGQITGPLTAASQAAEACAIFHTIIDAPKTTYGTDVIGDAGADDLVLHNVHFTYASRPDVKILDDLCLRFPAGKVTAIVGPSGSGKSTIVGILQRWYEFNGDPVTNPMVRLSSEMIVLLRILSPMSATDFVQGPLVPARNRCRRRPAIVRARYQMVAQPDWPRPTRQHSLQHDNLQKRRVWPDWNSVGRFK